MFIWASVALGGRACAGIIDPRNSCRRFGRVIKRNQAVIINAVALCPVLRRKVGREWSDMPQAEVEDVGHAAEHSPKVSRLGCARYR